MTRIDLGLVVTGVDSSDTTPSVQLEACLTLAATARDHGFSHLAVGQHFLGHPYQFLQPIPLLGRLSAESGDLRLVTGVLLLSMLHPVDVAEQLATLDVLTEGRLVVGVGAGYRAEEFAAFGVDRSSRARRLLEALDVMRQLWTGDVVNHDGEFFELHSARPGVLPIQSGGPPIWMAGMRERTVQRASHLGHLPFVGPGATFEQVAEWAEAHRRSTGDPHASIPVRRDVFVGRTDDEALDGAMRFATERLQSYQRWGMGRDTASGRRTGPTAQRVLLENQLIVGDPDHVRSELRKLADVGAGPIVLRVQWPHLPIERSAEMVRLLGR